jgi:hypothetical protein
MKYNFEGTVRTLPDLLPCPFCGCAKQPTSKGRNKLMFADFAWGPDCSADGEYAYMVLCGRCGTEGPKGDRQSLLMAANAWNRRPR